MYNISFFEGDQTNVYPSEAEKGNYENFEGLTKDRRLTQCYDGMKRQGYFVRGECIGTRQDKDIPLSRLLVIDGDEGKEGGNAPDPQKVADFLESEGINFILTTTHSHSAEKNKFRVIIPTDKEYERKDLVYNIIRLLRKLGSAGLHITAPGGEMKSWSQPWYLPKRDDINDGLYKCWTYYEGKDWEIIYVKGEAEKEKDSEEAKEESYSEPKGKTLEESMHDIINGSNIHRPVRDFAYQAVADDGDGKFAFHKAALRVMMEAALGRHGPERDSDIYNRLKDLDRQFQTAIDKKDSDSRIGDAPEVRTGRIPSFPNGVMSTWPEPWPMIYEAYSSVARDPVEELLVPTILSTCAHLLNNKYITMEGKLLNLIFLNLASSGVGKDANTTSILKELSNIFLRVESSMPIDPFNQFTQFNKSLSSDTAFMQCFNDEGDFFWVNTEATRIFEMMGTKGNSSVAAISDKLVEVGDGMGISSKKKVSAKDAAPSQPNPNCQVLLCAQPDTISSYLTHNMIDSGLFGRPLVSVSAAEFDYDEYDMFGRRDVRKLKLSDDFIDLFIHLYKIEKRGNGGIFKQIALGAEGDQTRELNTWMKNKIMPHMKSDPMLMTVLRRMGIPIEQVYTVVLAIINEYEELRGYNKTVRIDIALLIPLFDFWVDCKVYATNHLVKNDADPLAKAIQEVMIECINGTIGMSKTGHVKAIKERKIPLARLSNILQCRSTLLKELELSGDRVGLQNRVKQTISALIDLGVIIKCKSGSISCIAFAD